ncbi:MAG: hypothetical protein AGIKBDMD_00170 [Synergistaceae bacterium]
MAPALFLLKYVDLALEVLVRRDASGFRQYLSALHVVLAYSAEKYSYVVSRFCVVKDLAEHLKAGRYCLLRVLDAYDRYFVSGPDYALLDPAGNYCAAAGDREDVFDRHEEGKLNFAHRCRNEVVACLHEFLDLCCPFVVCIALKCLQRAAAYDGNVVSGELVLAQKVSDLHLHKVEKFGVVNHVALVHEDYECGHVDLTSKKYVLAGLGHRAVCC